jgi:hypothetical protein
MCLYTLFDGPLPAKDETTADVGQYPMPMGWRQATPEGWVNLKLARAITIVVCSEKNDMELARCCMRSVPECQIQSACHHLPTGHPVYRCIGLGQCRWTYAQICKVVFKPPQQLPSRMLDKQNRFMTHTRQVCKEGRAKTKLAPWPFF